MSRLSQVDCLGMNESSLGLSSEATPKHGGRIQDFKATEMNGAKGILSYTANTNVPGDAPVGLPRRANDIKVIPTPR